MKSLIRFENIQQLRFVRAQSKAWDNHNGRHDPFIQNFHEHRYELETLP
jgi:hypothetical protein